ncbi:MULTISPECIES: 2-oxoglutarate/malate transporter [unclassified Streptomyces]|uniref:2-oxoglutarate/malate transporter n=1 Tax=unclassified Streptomyces TaxID=2593676 RepID=UPI00336A82ED
MLRQSWWPFHGTAMGFSRISGIAALGFAFLIVFSNVIQVPAGMPLTGADVDEVDAFFGAKAGVVGVGSALTPAAWALATLFGAGAVSALWRSERDRGEAWSLLGFAGLILQNAAFAGVIAVRLALASTAGDRAAGTSGLWAFHDALFTLNGTFLALALVGLSVGGLRSGLIRSWHGALGLLSAALLFASATLVPLVIDHAGPLGLLGLVGWLMWVVWLAAYGTALIRLNPAGRSCAPG